MVLWFLHLHLKPAWLWWDISEVRHLQSLSPANRNRAPEQYSHMSNTQHLRHFRFIRTGSHNLFTKEKSSILYCITTYSGTEVKQQGNWNNCLRSQHTNKTYQGQPARNCRQNVWFIRLHVSDFQKLLTKLHWGWNETSSGIQVHRILHRNQTIPLSVSLSLVLSLLYVFFFLLLL